MSDTTTSLDIQKGEGTVLDIAQAFPVTIIQTLDLARQGELVDSMIAGESNYPNIDLSINTIVHINRFSTLDMLDIALPEIVDPSLWEKGLLGVNARPRLLNIIPPLAIPYGSLDIRREDTISNKILQKNEKIPFSGTIDIKNKKINYLENTTSGNLQYYPDLFGRKLPYGLFTRRIIRGVKGLVFQYQKQAFIAVVLFLILSIPLLSYVVYALNRGYSTLEQITDTRDPQSIRTMIRSARGDFERSNFLLMPFAWIPLSQMDSIYRITTGGLALTRGLDTIAQSLPIFATSSGVVVKKEMQDPLAYRGASHDIFLMESLGISNPTDWIRENHTILEQARSELLLAGDLYKGITITGERTIRIQKIGKTLSIIANVFDWSLKNQKDILNMLGDTNPQRYIVFNQNRDEIRANGGFPGSILSFSLYKGNILDYHGDDVYYYDWNLFPYKEMPPPGIILLTDSYGLRDVNYYPDFHETLDKANGFIERSGEASVTTALAIHQGIIEDILEKVGPVTVTGVTIPFDSKNFSVLMSTLVENKYAKENTPKDILFEFISALIKKIQQKNAPLELLELLNGYLESGEILFASRDKDIDDFLSPYKKKLPWELSAQNWIYPVWTSVSGNKSDRYMVRTYQAGTRKIEECKYENTISIETKHTYGKKESTELLGYFQTFGITDSDERAKLDFIQGNGQNRAYLRVYVPLGATLIGSGSDITTTQNQQATVFSLLMDTPVGSRTTKSWKYMIDIPNCVNYDNKIEWTKQPGLREVIIK